MYYPNSTALRRNPIYYNVYCVGLNTCFATLLPLVALLFLNIATLRALRLLGKAASTSTGVLSGDDLRRGSTSMNNEHNNSVYSGFGRGRSIQWGSMASTSNSRRYHLKFCGLANADPSSDEPNGILR